MLDIAAYPVTTALLAANLVLSGYALTTPGQLDNFVFNTGAILRGKQYYRMITSGFIHADALHFFFNMFTLYNFGPFMEAVMGPVGYLIMYFGALLGGSFLSLHHNRNDMQYSALGASGAVSGVICGFCLIAPFASLGIFGVPGGIPAFLFAGIYLVVSIWFMGNTSDVRRGGIGHDAHLGGAVAGMALTALLAWDRLYFI